MLQYNNTCHSWTELNTNNNKIDLWGRDLLGKHLCSFFLCLSAPIPSPRLLERWPQVCPVKITFILLLTNRFDSTTTKMKKKEGKRNEIESFKKPFPSTLKIAVGLKCAVGLKIHASCWNDENTRGGSCYSAYLQQQQQGKSNLWHHAYQDTWSSKSSTRTWRDLIYIFNHQGHDHIAQSSLKYKIN